MHINTSYLCAKPIKFIKIKNKNQTMILAILQAIFGFAMIIAGIIGLVVPLVPGTFLIIIGVGLIFHLSVRTVIKRIKNNSQI